MPLAQEMASCVCALSATFPTWARRFFVRDLLALAFGFVGFRCTGVLVMFIPTHSAKETTANPGPPVLVFLVSRISLYSHPPPRSA